MLPAFARRPLLARLVNRAIAFPLHASSSSLLHASTSSLSSSLLRPSSLSTHRFFADSANSATQPTATSTSPKSSQPASTTSDTSSSATSSSSTTLPDSSSTSAAPRKRSYTRRKDSAKQQSKAREKQLALLLRAKVQERTKKEMERAAKARMKKQLQRIVKREEAIAKTAVQRQKRQAVKDKLRAKAAQEKQLRVEERAVAQRYRKVRASRPKRPLSAFLSFSESVRTSLPTSDTGARLSPIETTRLAAARWRDLSVEEKNKYDTQYKAALPAYEQAMQQYNEQQRSKRPPTRPLNAYARYAQQRIKDIRAAEGGGSKASELMKRIAVEWKGVSTEEKDQLRQQMEGEKAGYAERLKAWESRPADEQAMWRLQRSTERKKRAKRRAKTALTKQATGKAAGTASQQ